MIDHTMYQSKILLDNKKFETLHAQLFVMRNRCTISTLTGVQAHLLPKCMVLTYACTYISAGTYLQDM